MRALFYKAVGVISQHENDCLDSPRNETGLVFS